MSDVQVEETAEEEMTRLAAEGDAFVAEVAERVQALQDEGVGDNLHGVLAVLLNPQLDVEDREALIVDVVLKVIASRELRREKA